MIRIGVIGCSNIAERAVIPAICGLTDIFELAGVASRSADKAVSFARKFSCKPYDDYMSLVLDEGIDAVYIPLPNALHAEWIEKSLHRGLHVLVEKSLGCSHEEVTRLCNLAESKGLALVENFQFRFHRQTKMIQDILASGKVGDLRCMRSSFGFPPFPDGTNIRYSKKLGGGALLDAGAYTLKVSQIILGPSLEVASANLWEDVNHGVDIWGGAYLMERNGPMFSEVAFGFDQQYKCSIELWGSKGCLTTDRIFTAPADHIAKLHIQNGIKSDVIEVEPDDHFQAMLRHFHRLVNGEADLKTEYEQNINQARLISEVFAKAKYCS